MLSSAAVSGQADSGFYCQTLVTGGLFVVVLLSGQKTDADMELGRNILGKIEELVSQTPEITPAEVVEMQGGGNLNEINISLIVGKIESQKLTVGAKGQVGAKILRRDKLINLVVTDDNESTATREVSGPLLHGDLIIYGTTDFLQSINSSDLLSWATADVQNIQEAMTSRVEGAKNREKMGGIFVRVNLAAKIDEAVQTKPEPRIFQHGSQLAAIFSQPKRFVPTILNGQSESSKKNLYLIALAFLALISAVAFQLRSRNLETTLKNYSAIESSTVQSIESASKLIGLNDQIARSSLMQTRKDTISRIEKAFGTNWQSKNFSEKSKLLSLISRIDEQIARVSHVYSVSDLTTFYDFALLKSNPKIASANLHEGKMVALDSNNGAVYSLLSGNKQAGLVIGNNDLKNGKFVDFSGDNVFVFSDNGISQITLGDSNSIKQILKSSEKWGNIKGFATFGGNLYLLDGQNNQIWKYQGTDLGFADLVNYIKTGLPVDISKGMQMNVDGFVYVLNSSGQIARFSGGDFSDFTISGTSEEFSSIKSFYTSDDVQNIYFWDESGKILVVDKKGTYQAEYRMPANKITNPIILADESAKKIFLLTGSKVYGVEMKQ